MILSHTTQRDRREVIQDSSTASLIRNVRADTELQQLTPGEADQDIIVRGVEILRHLYVVCLCR